MPTHYQWQGGDLILRCHIQPGASKDGFSGLHGERLKIRISSPPVAGGANQQLIKFLAKQFNISKAQITITQGETSRQKTVCVKAPRSIPNECEVNKS
jgi:uncharacterized protein (TIGR00251 family)